MVMRFSPSTRETGVRMARNFRLRLRLRKPALCSRFDKGGSTAIQNGNFRPVDVDVQIVNSEGRQGSKKMFNGGDGQSPFAQDSGHPGIHHVGGNRFNGNRPFSGRTVKNDPCSRLCRSQSQVDAVSGMQTDSGEHDWMGNRALKNHEGHLSLDNGYYSLCKEPARA